MRFFEMVNLMELTDKEVTNLEQKPLYLLKNASILQLEEDELLNIASG